MEDTEYWYKSEATNWNSSRRYSNFHYDPQITDHEGIKLNFVKFEGDWSEELANTVYDRRAPWNLDELLVKNVHQEYIELGLDRMRLQSMRCVPTKETHPKIWSMVEATGLKDPLAMIMGQKPGEMQTTHLDVICCNATGERELTESMDDVEFDDTSARFFITLTDWKWGQFVHMGNYTWSQWKAGDTMLFDWKNLPHSTANAGLILRPLLKVTGTITPEWEEFIKNDNKVIQV
tara:strand:+ start:284 stop:985 length:702 start_codon:yes stop_codon:yes gene_type:complete